MGTFKVLRVLTVLCLPAWYRAGLESALPLFAPASQASGIAIFRQLLSFVSPFNPFPDLLTEEASGWTVMVSKRTAAGKLLLSGPAHLGVTSSNM